jgi:hypothetical protein
MADDNDTRLWNLLVEILEDAVADVVPDALAVEAARRDPGVLKGGEGWQQFLDRVRELLRRKGALNGTGAGATVRALTTSALRERAGLSLEGRTASDYELAALAIAGARPGAAAGVVRCRPESTPVEAPLSLESLAEQAAARAEHERLAALLSPPATRPRRR